ncbi:flagellar basal body P-ring protein FlgI [Pseudomonas fluvialis]|uniref:Flagellar P-ring protein n=1 Tax=Pseudomonas fluvialis TaxID=1793966 RepID=A0ABQ2AQG9_9PSED|nr:flagellar basal body P-ring protein FlgI [Pseudomonas sp.]OXM40708.1 flagellar biosynthesis protein FlgI [Pseudomonas fluvialis]GGH94519.1 flagellar P-ring protein [Pseudomonas fluvialis]
MNPCSFHSRTAYSLVAVLGLLWLMLAAPVQAARLKDLASIQGVRSNQLIGYGLVVGLNGTGDQTTQTPFTLQTFNNMLAQFGIKVPAGSGNVQLKNVAAVSVHAELPAFAKPGQTIDITVSSIGNAKSLRGGSLLLTPLKGIDGNVYAVAQGNLVVGGFDAQGGDGSRITVNVPSAGRIPSGATVERAVPSGFDQGNSLVLNLNRPDFTTAKNIVDTLNELLGPGVARALDGASISVSAPADPGQRVDYLSIIENLDVEVGQAVAKVIINSRTGTIVIGQNVKVQPAAVTHGSLTVTITEDPIVSQPEALSAGETAVVPRSRVNAEQEARPMFKFGPGTTLDEIVRAVNQVGAAPSDLMAILEALKQAGALQADLIVI